jgi:hypothetical protein
MGQGERKGVLGSLFVCNQQLRSVVAFGPELTPPKYPEKCGHAGEMKLSAYAFAGPVIATRFIREPHRRLPASKPS